MILLGKSKSKTLRCNLYVSTTENPQLSRVIVRTNQTSKMEPFKKLEPLTIFAKSSILDV